MKSYSLNKKFVDYVEDVFIVVSFAEQGEFATAREMILAMDQGNLPHDRSSGGRNHHLFFSPRIPPACT